MDKIMKKKTYAFIGILIIVFVSMYFNVNYVLLVQTRERETAIKKNEALDHAKHAFKKYYKEISKNNQEMTDEMINIFDIKIIYNSRTNSWDVRFIYEDKSIPTKTVYKFSVKCNFTTNFEGWDQTG